MSDKARTDSSRVVDWGAGERRRQSLEAELERIVGELPRLRVRRALVFGSFARGEVGGGSDLDLLLVAESDEPFIARGLRFYQELAPSVGLDLFVYTPAEFEAMRSGSFLRRVLAEGRTIYEA